ncbi:membrane protein insertion efficiency factor YidD [Paracoccus alkanivorans]|uniref:Membrane protein insertion efficiency factor YidD n=1 Tax=Paracoccus alkanivorans TaxID=2116655 RepID=A0A3M0N0J6_9RHOB|nr:membrane protein insertion efficiency factor YidD [Paracoccus alkanivorans]
MSGFGHIWRITRCNPFGGSGHDPVSHALDSRPRAARSAFST